MSNRYVPPAFFIGFVIGFIGYRLAGPMAVILMCLGAGIGLLMVGRR